MVAVKKTVYFVAKHDLRRKGVMYKCHGFRVKNSARAKTLAQEIAHTCNTVFNQVGQKCADAESTERERESVCVCVCVWMGVFR